ncbi:hypothetical protein DFH28DRAFT_1184081 [Melampsora americana]|nr:hypothetical protein DFH28DRAFT_1184081 [Melampsora americana]
MKELVGDPSLAVTGICTTGPNQLTAEELALGNSDEEEVQGKKDNVRGAELTIDDSDEEGVPLFEPHSIKLIDCSNQDKNKLSSPDPTPKIEGKAPQHPTPIHITTSNSPSQDKPKTRTRPASRANIATALNNAANLAQNKNNSALEREKIRAESSAAHNPCKEIFLRTEENCAFFIQLAEDLRWPWILEEIELSAQN